MCRRRCWPAAGSSPVPTIACPVGAQTYAYDPFDRDMGWWALTSPTEIAGGEMRIPSASTARTGNIFGAKSRALVGAEEATIIANLNATRFDGSTYGGGIRWGLTTSPWIGLNYQSGTGTVRAIVSTQANLSNAANLYAANSPIANNASGTVEIKIIAKVASTEYYINGVLVYTGAAIVISGSTAIASADVARYSATQGIYSLGGFAYFGYNLPVICS